MQCYFEIYINRAMRRYLILIFICLFSLSGIWAQRQITGKVIDGSLNEPAIGASVLVEGTDLGTITDMDGLFSLSVPDDVSFLLVSMVGYKTERVSIRSTDNVKVLLSEDVQLTFENNIVLVAGGEAMSGDALKSGRFVFKDNCFYDVNGQGLTVNGSSLDTWMSSRNHTFQTSDPRLRRPEKRITA